MTTLGLIPARAGSKGIPGKNLRSFKAKTLTAWAVETAYAAGLSAIACTSDSWKILDEASKAGPAIPILRPEELARDDTPMLPVVQHALDFLRPYTWDVVVLLQPTQPLRRPNHVREAIQLLLETDADSVVSVVEMPSHYAPENVVAVNDDGWLEPWEVRIDLSPDMDAMPTRRQDAKPAYTRDGTVYVARRKLIEEGYLYGLDCKALIIPRSESVNLDTEEDWAVLEAMQ